MFNTFFHSVFTHSLFSLPPLDELPIPDSTITDISISESDVHKALSSLKSINGHRRDWTETLETLCFSTTIHHPFKLSISHFYVGLVM